MLYHGRQKFKYGDKEDWQLVPPMGLSRHFVSPTHEHVCHEYFATTDTDKVIPEKPDDVWKWVSKEELETMDLKPNVRFFAMKALETLSR